MAEPSADDNAQPRVARLTREEMEAAALEGRQVAGELDRATALRRAARR